MIARVLSRYADAALRAELDRTRQQRDNYRGLALAIAGRLKVARRDLAAALNQETQQ